MKGPSVAVALRLALSIAVFAAVLWFIDVRQFTARLAAAHLGWFGVALSANLAAVYFSARTLSSLCGGMVAPGAIFRVNLKSIYFGTFIPGDVAAGLVARIRYLGLATWQQVVHLTVVERLVGLAAFSVIAALALTWSSFLEALGPVAFAMPLAVLAAAALGIALVGGSEALVGRASFLRRVYEKLAPAGPTSRPVLSPATFAWSAATQLCTSLLAFAALRSLGLEVGLLDAIVVGYLIALAQLVPFFFAGAGVRDVSAISLLGSIGIRPEMAVAFSTLVLAVILILAVGGGLLQVRTESEGIGNAGR